MKNVLFAVGVFIAAIALHCGSAEAIPDYTLKPLPGVAKPVTYSSVAHQYAAQIAADRAELRKLAGASGHARERAALLAQIRHDRLAIAWIRRGASPAKWAPRLRPRYAAPGQLGVFRFGYEGAVTELLPAHAALVRLYYPAVPADSRLARFQGWGALSARQGAELAAQFRSDRSKAFYLCGYKTKGWTCASDCNFSIPGPCQISTYTYTTVTGASNTVLMISPVRFVDDLHAKKHKK